MVVVFSWIVCSSRSARDRIDRKGMADPRMQALMETGSALVGGKRMIRGGLRTLVEF